MIRPTPPSGRPIRSKVLRRRDRSVSGSTSISTMSVRSVRCASVPGFVYPTMSCNGLRAVCGAKNKKMMAAAQVKAIGNKMLGGMAIQTNLCDRRRDCSGETGGEAGLDGAKDYRYCFLSDRFAVAKAAERIDRRIGLFQCRVLPQRHTGGIRGAGGEIFQCFHIAITERGRYLVGSRGG